MSNKVGEKKNMGGVSSHYCSLFLSGLSYTEYLKYKIIISIKYKMQIAYI